MILYAPIFMNKKYSKNKYYLQNLEKIILDIFS